MLTRSQSAWKRAIDRDIEVIGRLAWIVEHDMDYNKEVPLRINTLDGYSTQSFTHPFTHLHIYPFTHSLFRFIHFLNS